MATYTIDSVNGDDSNDGTTAPWKTLGKHNASTFSAGDDIELVGTFTEILIPPSSGSSGSPVEYRTKSGEAQAVIDGGGTRGQCIKNHKDYVTFENLLLKEATDHCFLSSHGNKFVTIRDLVCEGSDEVGALIRTDDFNSFDCIFRNNTHQGVSTQNFSRIAFSGDRSHNNGRDGWLVSPGFTITFDNCEADNNGADDYEGNGWNVNQETSTGIRLTKCRGHHNMGNGLVTFDANDTIIEYCEFDNNTMGSQVSGKAAGVRCDQDTDGSTIRWCHIHHNESAGVVLEQWAKDCLIKGNLIHHNGSGVSHGNSSSTGNTLEGNIIRASTGTEGDIFVNDGDALIINGLSIAATNLKITSQ
jgi:hypothetical protein